MTERCRRIKIGNGGVSAIADLPSGVPQESVLGPPLFTIYTIPFSSIISGHAIPHHLYADDSQLYASFTSGNSGAALNGLQLCLASVKFWMPMNKLNSSLLGMNNRSKCLFIFPIELVVSKITL